MGSAVSGSYPSPVSPKPVKKTAAQIIADAVAEDKPSE
jgi:hypothetical protein